MEILRWKLAKRNGLYGHEFDDIIIPKRVIPADPVDEYLTQPALDPIAFKIPNSIVDRCMVN